MQPLNASTLKLSNFESMTTWILLRFSGFKAIEEKTATATKQCVKYDGGFMSHLMSVFTPISRLFIILILNLNTSKDANLNSSLL